MTRWSNTRSSRGVALAAALFGAWQAGCRFGSGIQTCGQIPPGGCPIGRGGTCDDETCSGVYDCVGGDWTLVIPCDGGAGAGGSGGSGSAGGFGGSGGAGASGGGAGAGGACVHSSLVPTNEPAGCSPALLAPDCHASLADASCIEEACASGCLDFFVCTLDGWTDVAFCDDEGTLVVP